MPSRVSFHLKMSKIYLPKVLIVNYLKNVRFYLTPLAGFTGGIIATKA